MSTARVRLNTKVLDIFSPRAPNELEDLRCLSAAFAIDLIMEWGFDFSDSFRSQISNWIGSYSKLPDGEIKQYIKKQIEIAWQQPPRTIFENPISRHKRLQQSNRSICIPSFEEIKNELILAMPKRFNKPYD